jgi:hypothetical protein
MRSISESSSHTLGDLSCFKTPASFRVRQPARVREAAGSLHKERYLPRSQDSDCGLPAAWELTGNTLHSRPGDSLADPWFRAQKRDDHRARTVPSNKDVWPSSSKTETGSHPIAGARVRTTAICARRIYPSNPYRHGATPSPRAKTPAVRRDEVARLQPGTGGRCCRCSEVFRVQPGRYGASQQNNPRARNANDGSGNGRKDRFSHFPAPQREETVENLLVFGRRGDRNRDGRF